VQPLDFIAIIKNYWFLARKDYSLASVFPKANELEAIDSFVDRRDFFYDFACDFVWRGGDAVVAALA
jgi:hypothetical protein